MKNIEKLVKFQLQKIISKIPIIENNIENNIENITDLNIVTSDLPKDIKKSLENTDNNLNINEKLVASQDNINIELNNTDLFNINENNYNKLPKINRLTRKKKYKLGKIKGNNHIGVLIKNKQTQNNIKNEVE